MYTELHARSAFSFLEGASIPEELAGVCAEKGMGAMALLDRDGVYGAPRFHLAADKLSLQAHVGAEITAAAGWRYAVLVESRAGYQNLCRLITQMKLHAQKGEGRIGAEEFAGRTAGLICLTGGEEGPLAHALSQGGVEQATRMRPATLRSFRSRKRLRGIAAAFLPRRRGPQSGGAGDRAQIVVCPCWPPMESAMRCRTSAKCWTSSPAFATIAT